MKLLGKSFLRNREFTPAGIGAASLWLVLCLWAGLFWRWDSFLVTIEHLEMPVLFKAREFFGRSTKLHPSLKIIGVDDKFVESSKSDGLVSDEKWLSYFRKIAERKPAAIIYDGNFSLNMGGEGENFVVSERDAVSVPLFVGVAPSRSKGIVTFNSAPLRCEDIGNYICDEDSSKNLAKVFSRHKESLLPLGGVLEGIRYPIHKWNPMIRGLGHIYWKRQNSGRLFPVFYSKHSEQPFPYLGISGFGKWLIDGGDFIVNGVKVPVDEDGFMPVNYVSLPNLLARGSATSALSLKRAYEKGNPFDFVKEGDHVVIVPYMFTGNPDMIWTPFGELPGGLVLAAVGNSVLNKDFLKPVLSKRDAVLAAGVFIWVVTMFASWAAAVGVTFLAAFTSIVLAMFLFSFASLYLPWVWVLMTILAVGVPILTGRSIVRELRSRRFHLLFGGKLSDEKLSYVAKNLNLLDTKPREVDISVMFVDIEGFSVLVENMVAETAFRELKEILDLISGCVHDFGGVIDKSLGDGVLAYFGHELTSNVYKGNHADTAFLCAREMQRRNTNIVRNLHDPNKFFPLRIGINSCTAFVGNIGSEKRLDYTVVGNGVNFAKRLEAACTANRITISEEALRRISSHIKEPIHFEIKSVSVKHHQKPIDVFEANPYVHAPEFEAVLAKISSERILLNRASIRVNVLDPGIFRVGLDGNKAELRNFSRTGLSLVLVGTGLGRGVKIMFSLDTEDGELSSSLKKDGIEMLEAVVVWSSDGGVVEGKQTWRVGLSFVSLTLEQSQRFFESVSRCLSKSSQSKIVAGSSNEIID